MDWTSSRARRGHWSSISTTSRATETCRMLRRCLPISSRAMPWRQPRHGSAERWAVSVRSFAHRRNEGGYHAERSNAAGCDRRRRQLCVVPGAGCRVLPDRRGRRVRARPDACEPRRLSRAGRPVLRRLRRGRGQGGPRPVRGDLRAAQQHDQVCRRAEAERARPPRHDARRRGRVRRHQGQEGGRGDGQHREDPQDTGTDVVVNYLPVGSEMATKWYVEQVLDAGCAFVNCIPVFIASQPYWARRFAERKLPVMGDDIKSQVGSTIVHRVLTTLFRERGVRLDRTYQLNFGGNMDFYNMLERERLESKKLSKTDAVISQLHEKLSDDDAHVGPSDHVPWLSDRKWCYIRLEGTTFGNVPLNVELKLEVWDSPNSSGVVIDA